MWRRVGRIFLPTLLMVGLWPGLVAGADFQLSASAQGMLAKMGKDWGGAACLNLSSAWMPRPEWGLGLDAAILLPLRVGSGASTADLGLRLTPAAWLFLGDQESWGFFKLGAGVDGLLLDSNMVPIFVLVGGAGYAVAPANLRVFFGFELCGELGLAGEATLWNVGLGGFIGWRI